MKIHVDLQWKHFMRMSALDPFMNWTNIALSLLVDQCVILDFRRLESRAIMLRENCLERMMLLFELEARTDSEL